MDKHIRSIAVACAVFAFFFMSCIGCACGLQPATACTRAVFGAIVVYLTASLVAKSILIIIVNAIADAAIRHAKEDDKQ